MRPDNIKVLQEKTVRNLFDIIHSNFFLHMSSEARETTAKTKTKTKTTKKLLGLHQKKKLLNNEGNN